MHTNRLRSLSINEQVMGSEKEDDLLRHACTLKKKIVKKYDDILEEDRK